MLYPIGMLINSSNRRAKILQEASIEDELKTREKRGLQQKYGLAIMPSTKSC